MAEKNSNKRPNTDGNDASKLNPNTLNASNVSHFPSHRYSDSDMSSSEQEDSSRRRREADRLAIVQQENVVLKMEVETLKLRIKNLLEENKKLRQDSINIVSKALMIYEYR